MMRSRYSWSWIAVSCVLAGSVAGQDREFRQALLLDASGNGRNAARIEALERELKAQGFTVTFVRDARKNGCRAYAAFRRGLAPHGKSLLYYCGDLEVRKINRQRRHLLQLGGHVPSAGRGTNGSVPDERMLEAVPAVSAQHLMVLDLENVRDLDQDGATYLKALDNGRFLRLNPAQEESISIYFSREGGAGADLAKILADSFARGGHTHNLLSPHCALTLGAGKAFSLRRKMLPVVSPPGTLVAGESGDHWLDENGIPFVWCPAGSFTMGTAEFEDARPREVAISNGFWMSRYELTQAQARSIDMKSSVVGDSRLKLKGHLENTPAICTNRDTAIAALAKLTAPKGWSYDLPTEAEWEYACRAGSTEDYPASERDLRLFANFADRSLYQAKGKFSDDAYIYARKDLDDGVGAAVAIVGSYRPNAWGLHDMHGNVSEWAADFYKKNVGGRIDPLDQALESDRKIHQRHGIFRGGAWCSLPVNLNSGYRGFFVSRYARFTGVRVILRRGERRALTVAEIHASLQRKGASK